MTDKFENSNAAAVRRPPQSVKSEQAILGGLMIDNKAFDSIVDVVSSDDFCRRDHRLIFDEIARTIQAGRPADCLTVYEGLKKAGLDNEAGGFQYLTDLVSNNPSSANIRRYAEIVREQSTLRNLITAGDRMVSNALNPEGRDVREILDEAEREVLQINERNARGRRGFMPMHSLVRDVSERIIRLHQNPEASEVTGVATGYRNLDKVTAGLQRGDLIILAARPSMGKTAFALNIAENIGIKQGLPVAIFSMEMGADQLVQRMLASIGHLDSQRLRKGTLSNDEWDKFVSCVALLEKKPIFIDDTAGLTVTELSSRARRLMNQTGPLGLVVVDYIQLMNGKGENRTTILSDISRGLKGLAKELHCPVLVLSQLSRAVEARTNNRPMMSDLRESGAIEQDADIIMFIYREVRYNPNTEFKDLAEIIIAKQRNGPVGTLRMTFLGEQTRFEPTADEGYYEGN